MPKAKVNGFEMYHEKTGEGTPLIMIMGLGANSEWWDEELITQLSEHFKVITLDNRGTGRSEDPGEDFSLETLADDVIGLMDELDIPKAHIMGISMGGMIAQHIALNYPEKVIKLVLCSTSPGGLKSKMPSREVLKQISKPREGRAIEEIIDETIPLLFTDDFIEANPDYIEKARERISKYPITPENYERQGNAIFKHRTGRKLKKMNLPTLLMHGEKDILLPVGNAQILHDLIPNSEIATFEKSAHALFSQEPDKVLSTLIEFLQD